jgi:hypothetical protein
VVIGPREQAILEAVHQYRYLTRNQTVALLFNPHSATWVDDKLKRLYHNQYLQRIFQPMAPGSGGTPAIYCLDKQGRNYLARRKGLAKTDMQWRKATDTFRDLPFLDHTLRINDFRIAWELASQNSGATMDWIDERTLKGDHYKARILNPSGHGSLVVVPDGYTRLRINGVQYCFFLELDNGSQEKTAVRKKIRAHILFSRGDYQERYGSTSLTVLMVTSQDSQRLGQLMDWCKEELAKTGTVHETELFLFARLQDLNPESVLKASVWWRAGKGNPGPLLA